MKILKRIYLFILYSIIIVISLYISYELRFDFTVRYDFYHKILNITLLFLLLKLLVLYALRQFNVILGYFSIPDLVKINAAMLSAALIMIMLRNLEVEKYSIPRSIILADFVISSFLICLIRVLFRIYNDKKHSEILKSTDIKFKNVVLIGAGDLGAKLLREFQVNPSIGINVIFFLDDDLNKHGNLIHGVPVIGYPEDISSFKNEYNIDYCIVSMPLMNGRRLRDLNTLFIKNNLKLEIIPSLSEIASGSVQISKTRPVQVEDLLGRSPVNLDSSRIKEYITNKVVLVTGAGGSIGSELCRQILIHKPSILLLVEQSEAALFKIEQELIELGYSNIIIPLVADILDQKRMSDILIKFRPSLLFHAAAHKHVYMMERQPAEAVKNNTIGSRLLAELAILYKVNIFIFISTDKAINPTSVMGASKRMAELHLIALQNSSTQETRFLTVRFGNVLGSSGSVITIFKKQIENGGPVTVTHPDVTRFFMTIPEAVGLILQTLIIGKGGEIFVLDMGNSIKIIELARQVIELSGFKPDEDIEIKITGLRPGEKLYEELQHNTESLIVTSHPRIKLLKQTIDSFRCDIWSKNCIINVEEICETVDSNKLKILIREMIPEYHPYID